MRLLQTQPNPIPGIPFYTFTKRVLAWARTVNYKPG
jgi:hypothetical protein